MLQFLAYTGLALAAVFVLSPILAGVLCLILRVPLAPCAVDYIPTKDADFDSWSANFESQIDTEFATYGLDNAQATAYTTLDTAWRTAYAAAVNPATRTPVTVAAKDAARAAAVANARSLALIINAYPGVTNAMRTTLGLNPRGDGPTPIPAPTTKPLPTVVAYNPLQHVLQIRDVTTPASRKKPFGAIACQVFSKVGATAPADISECELRGLYTKPFLVIDYDGADAGQKAWYICRWVTRRGLTGPTSDLISATITAA